LGIELSYREQFNAAIESSDCEAAASYGKEILAVVPDDAEVNRLLRAARCIRRAGRCGGAGEIRLPGRASLATRYWPRSLAMTRPKKP